MLRKVVRVLCLTHVDFEGPARVADWARDRGHTLTVIRADLACELHPPEPLSGLVVMGGPMSAKRFVPLDAPGIGIYRTGAQSGNARAGSLSGRTAARAYLRCAGLSCRT